MDHALAVAPGDEQECHRPQAVRFALANLLDGSTAPLYLRYATQSGPQPAFVGLSEHGVVSAGYCTELDGTPMRNYQRLDLRFAVSPYSKGQVLADLLQTDAAVDLLTKIHNGHWVRWDGTAHVGELSEDAEEAAVALERLLAEKFSTGEADCCDRIWSAQAWLMSTCGIHEHWTSQTLDEAVQALQSLAHAEKVVISGDLRKALLDAAQRQFKPAGYDGLRREHLEALVADGRITQEMVHARDD